MHFGMIPTGARVWVAAGITIPLRRRGARTAAEANEIRLFAAHNPVSFAGAKAPST